MNYIREYCDFLHRDESSKYLINMFDCIMDGIDSGQIPYPEEKIEYIISTYEKKYGKLMGYQKALIACDCIVRYSEKK